MGIELKAQKAILKIEEDKNNLSGKIKIKSEGIINELNETFQTECDKMRDDAEKELKLQMDYFRASKEKCLDAMAFEYEESHLQWEDEIYAAILSINLEQKMD